MLLIHGLGGSRAAWPGVAAPLAATHRVIGMDLRGSGESPLGDEPLSFAVLAADAIAVLDAVSIEKAHVIGHSLGGVVTQELLVGHPGRVASAVLVSTSSRVGEAAAKGWLRLADVVETRGLSDSPGSRSRAFAEGFEVRNPALVEELAHIAAASDRYGYAAQARIAASYDYTDALAGVRAPCLVIQGLADRLTSPGGSVILQRAIEGARLEMIEGVGHNAHLEMGDRFVDMATRFFAEVDRPA
ncbi:MAG: alpha/beta hydrolase [Candidatus Binatia bacterium]